MKKEINATIDYKRFKKLNHNKEINLRKIQKIKQSIEDVGYITNPIIVNEKFEIINGEARFNALKELKKPIEYIIVDGIGLKESIVLNTNQTNWNTNDFINSYAKQRKLSYIYLKKLQDEFPLIQKLNVFFVALFNKEKVPIDNIASGELHIGDQRYHEAQEKISKIYKIAKYGTKKTLGIIKALIYCQSIKEVDMKKMLKEVEKQAKANSLPPISTTNGGIQYIESLYNQNASKKVQLFIKYREYLEQVKKCEKIAKKD